MSKLKVENIGVYGKAIVAFIGALATFLISAQTIGVQAGFTVPAWVYGLGVAMAGLTGGATYQKRNHDPVAAFDAVTDVIDDYIRVPTAPQVQWRQPDSLPAPAGADVLRAIEDLITSYKR